MSLFRNSSFVANDLSGASASFAGAGRQTTLLHMSGAGPAAASAASSVPADVLDVLELPHAATCVAAIQFGDITTLVVAGDSRVTAGNIASTTLVGLRSGEGVSGGPASSITIRDGLVSCLDVKCVVSPQRGGNYLAYGAVGTTTGAIIMFAISLDAHQLPTIDVLLDAKSGSLRSGSGYSASFPVDSIAIGIDSCCHLEFVVAASAGVVAVLDGRSVEDLFYLQGLEGHGAGGAERDAHLLSSTQSKVGALVMKRHVATGEEVVRVIAPTQSAAAFHPTCAAVVVTSAGNLYPITRSEMTLSSATAMLQRSMPPQLTAAIRSGLSDRHTPLSLLNRTVYAYELELGSVLNAPSTSSNAAAPTSYIVSDAVLSYELSDQRLNICNVHVAGINFLSSSSAGQHRHAVTHDDDGLRPGHSLDTTVVLSASENFGQQQQQSTTSFWGTYRHVLAAKQSLDVSYRQSTSTMREVKDRRSGRGFSLIKIYSGQLALLASGADLFVGNLPREDSDGAVVGVPAAAAALVGIKQLLSLPTVVNDVVVVTASSSSMLVAGCGRSLFLIGNA